MSVGLCKTLPGNNPIYHAAGAVTTTVSRRQPGLRLISHTVADSLPQKYAMLCSASQRTDWRADLALVSLLMLCTGRSLLYRCGEAYLSLSTDPHKRFHLEQRSSFSTRLEANMSNKNPDLSEVHMT